MVVSFFYGFCLFYGDCFFCFFIDTVDITAQSFVLFYCNRLCTFFDSFFREKNQIMAVLRTFEKQ